MERGGRGRAREGERRVERRDRGENIAARPSGLGSKVESVIPAVDLDMPGRRKGDTSSRMEEEIRVQCCPCSKERENRTHMVEQCEPQKG